MKMLENFEDFLNESSEMVIVTQYKYAIKSAGLDVGNVQVNDSNFTIVLGSEIQIDKLSKLQNQIEKKNKVYDAIAIIIADDMGYLSLSVDY